MQEIQLSLLIITPLLAAFIGLFVPTRSTGLFRYLSLAANILQCIVLISLLVSYHPAAGTQFVEYQPWITIGLKMGSS